MEDNRQNYVENEEVEIDLVEMFFELLNHWKVIVSVTVVAGLLTFGYFKFLVTPMYRSTVELYMLDSSTIISSLADIQIGNNLATDYMEVIQSRPVVDKVINNLKLDTNYKALQKRLSVANKSNTHIISISVIDEDASNAKKIVDEFANVSKIFISDKMGQKEPSILHLGYIDYSKVSPTVVRNTVIGALAGFVLSSGVVIAFWLLNDNIRYEEDVERKLGLVVLGTVPYERNEDGALTKATDNENKEDDTLTKVTDKEKSKNKEDVTLKKATDNKNKKDSALTETTDKKKKKNNKNKKESG